MERLIISSQRQKQIIDITEEISELLKHEKIKEGLCNIFIIHTTAAITTADLDPGTDLDMLDAFEKIMPKLRYRHPHNPEHSPDHILSSILGPGIMVPIEFGELVLGTWQRIIMVELDGPRDRTIIVTFIKTT